jgi:excisionase family DNA binding protein
MENNNLQKILEEFLTPIVERSVAVAIERQVGTIATNIKQQDEILTADDAANLIGVSLQTLYGLTSARKIPHNKRGKRLYFDRQELIAWIREGKRKSMSEIENEAAHYIGTTRYGKHTQPAQTKKH